MRQPPCRRRPNKCPGLRVCSLPLLGSASGQSHGDEREAHFGDTEEPAHWEESKNGKGVMIGSRKGYCTEKGIAIDKNGTEEEDAHLVLWLLPYSGGHTCKERVT